jgi:hypothetical protein
MQDIRPRADLVQCGNKVGGASITKELLLARAEDIGHFGPMFVHRFGGMSFVARTRSSEPSISSGLLAER